tara:strand:+ start:94 stop:381 length:288 start_codon:yes stop_codon:yes gene_type:complete
MKTKKRPFFKLSIYQIEKILKDRKPSDDMSDIIYELSFRKTQRAKALLKKLSNKTTKQSPLNRAKLNDQNSSDNLFKLVILGLLLLITLKVLEIF